MHGLFNAKAILVEGLYKYDLTHSWEEGKRVHYTLLQSPSPELQPLFYGDSYIGFVSQNR